MSMMVLVMKKISAFLSSAFAYLFLAFSAFAQNPTIGIDRAGLPGYTTLSGFLTAAIRLIFIIALLAVLFMLIWGALQWIFSGGEKEGVSGARNRILHALIGLAVLAVAFALVSAAGQFVGINLLGDLPIPTPNQPAPALPVPSPTGRI